MTSYHFDKPKIAPKGSLEIAIQASCKMRVETQFDAMFMAIPNGTYTSSRYARMTRSIEGLVKGAPDVIIIGGMKNAGKIAFAEIKAAGRLSDEQAILLADLHRTGHQVGVFRSQDTLANWLQSNGWV